MSVFKFFLKKGHGFRSYNIASRLIILLKKKRISDIFRFIGQAFTKIMPICSVRNEKRGKITLVLLGIISEDRAFFDAYTSIASNASKLNPERKTKKVDYAEKVFIELKNTINEKSESYKQKLDHLAKVNFSLSFGNKKRKPILLVKKKKKKKKKTAV